MFNFEFILNKRNKSYNRILVIYYLEHSLEFKIPLINYLSSHTETIICTASPHLSDI